MKSLPTCARNEREEIPDNFVSFMNTTSTDYSSALENWTNTGKSKSAFTRNVEKITGILLFSNTAVISTSHSNVSGNEVEKEVCEEKEAGKQPKAHSKTLIPPLQL